MAVTGELNTAILIVVPKRDELRAVASVFGFDPDNADGELQGGYEWWCSDVADMRTVFVSVDAQGSTKTALATRAALAQFRPTIAMCIGTAAGRAGRTQYLDAILATAVLDANEWSAQPEGLEAQWTHQAEPPRQVLHDIDAFVKREDWQDACRQRLVSALAAGSSAVENDILDDWPRVHDSWIVTTAFLHRDPVFLEQVWTLHGRLRGIDMETSGFIDACEDGPRLQPWVVVRGVSDFGTKESKRDDLRPASGLAAAAVAYMFVTDGLERAHPLMLDREEAQGQALSDRHFFTTLTMPEFLAEQLPRRLNVQVDRRALTSDLTVKDLMMLCGASRSGTLVRTALDELREDYFTQKYIDYDDDADVRGHVDKAWAEDVAGALAFLQVEAARSDVLYVGVGTGRDLEAVCPEFKSLRGVDLSTAMLARAREREPRLEAVRDRAEELGQVGDASVDLYLALRTFQSSLLDIDASLRQAFRVLRPGGALVLSIPGGYLDRDDKGALRFVPGLLVAGSNVVDRSAPRRVSVRILGQLENLMFERIGFHQRESDIYIYARKPGTLGVTPVS